MRISSELKATRMFAILFSLLLTGVCATTTCGADVGNAEYDYSASIDCLEEPLPPQYKGGVVKNPSFDSGPKYWKPFGAGKLTSRKTRKGNKFLVAFDRNNPFDSMAYWTHIHNQTIYVFSAWVQLDRGTHDVTVHYTGMDQKIITIGSVVAKSGCWSMLKGGFTADKDIKANFHFSCQNIETELWVDNVSLQPFTKSEWQAHQNRMIEQVRKRKVRIQIETRDEKQPFPGAKITLTQRQLKFTIGSGAPESILTSQPYQDYFRYRFTAVNPQNEMKWYFTEGGVQDQENYTVPDAMVAFFKENKIGVRGHAVLWADPKYIQPWVQALPTPKDLLKASLRRVGSVVSRYSGELIGWDVMNENVHYNFFESKLGSPNASAMIYQMVHAIDPNTPLFLNEFNSAEDPTDMDVIPSKYVARFREIRAFPGNENLPVSFGVQGHFNRTPMVSHIRAVFDILGATEMKIWITELDTRRGPFQAEELEEVMREAYAHPAVEGIIVWGGWKERNCRQECLEDMELKLQNSEGGCSMMCLVNNEFKNLPTGDVVDKLIKEWKMADGEEWVTDENGMVEMDVFLGEYELTFTHPTDQNNFGVHSLKVTSGKEPIELPPFNL